MTMQSVPRKLACLFCVVRATNYIKTALTLVVSSKLFDDLYAMEYRDMCIECIKTQITILHACVMISD